jgi:type VI secretion system protein ImpE
MQVLTLEQHFEEAKNRAKSSPGDLGARSALWQIFAARGEFERARKQLDMMSQIDSSWLIEVQACHGLLLAEEKRQDIFKGLQTPVCLGEPPAWYASLVAALPLLVQGSQDAAIALLKEAQLSASACPGFINESAFEWVCDGDARLGPCLEIIVQGRYFWAPWQSIRSLETRPPTEIRDHLWQPAMVQITEEGPIEAFIPVRYPDPHDEAQSISRTTEWKSLGDDFFIGFGQKCLITDSQQVGYLDVRQLRFN